MCYQNIEDTFAHGKAKDQGLGKVSCLTAPFWAVSRTYRGVEGH